MANRFAALVVFLFVELSPVMADPEFAQAEKSLEKITAVVEARQQQQLNPFVMNYTDKMFVSGRFLKKVHSMGATAKDGQGFSDQSFTANVEMARKGQMKKMRITGSEIGYAVAAPMKSPTIAAYDGKILKNFENRSNSFSVSVNPEKAVKSWDPWDVCGEKSLYGVLTKWRSKKNEGKFRLKKIIIREVHLKSGDPVTYLELINENKYSWKVWLLPDLGYCVHQLEEWDSQGKITRRHHDCHYQEVNGVPYPLSAVCTCFFDGKESNKSLEFQLHVQSVETDPKQIPDEMFKMEIPPNVSVKDLDANGALIGPQNTQAHIDKMISELPTNKYRIWLWLGSGLILATAAMVSFLLSRRYWRRARSSP